MQYFKTTRYVKQSKTERGFRSCFKKINTCDSALKRKLCLIMYERSKEMGICLEDIFSTEMMKDFTNNINFLEKS